MMMMTATTQYRSLDDAFGEAGDCEVWYMLPAWFREGIMGEKPDRNDLQATHALLGKIKPIFKASYTSSTLDDAWVRLQGERWSPNGEARTIIRTRGLQHTSMSVGDCFKLADGRVFMVANDGFDLVK